MGDLPCVATFRHSDTLKRGKLFHLQVINPTVSSAQKRSKAKPMESQMVMAIQSYRGYLK